MAMYDRLIAAGYFPKELPPTFNTDSYAAWLVGPGSAGSVIPGEKTVTKPSAHNLAQAGTLRRRLGIPNPIAAHHASRVVATHWGTIVAHLKVSQIAKSTPVLPIASSGTVGQRAILPAIALGGLPAARARTRSLGRYLLHADVARCYASIYTHSIPWALHSKPWAKANKSGGAGNDLDLVLRNGQDQQTLGLPIGPDWSFVAAECILASVDQILTTKCGVVRGYRFMDDYELSFPSHDQAQNAIGVLQEALAEFELALNPVKTRILELPCEHEAAWVAELRSFEFRTSSQGQANDLLRYFDRCYELAKDNPNAHVLQYGVSRLASVSIDASNWPLYQSLLTQASLAEPKTFRPYLSLLQVLQTKGFPIDLDSLEEAIQLQITRHAPLGHASEVAWSLWAALAFKLPIGVKAAAEVSRMDDVTVALLALHCQAAKQVPSGLDTTFWEQFLDAEELRRSRWLLSYESVVKGWLTPTNDHIKDDPFFAALRAANVSFYDPTRLTLTHAPVVKPPTGGGTSISLAS